MIFTALIFVVTACQIEESNGVVSFSTGDLTEATSPEMNINVDRRFDTEAFQEYDVMIATDYEGSNFGLADWTVYFPLVEAFEANDPGTDDYETITELDLSSYVGEEISIAFIYYAEGSKLTATILRINDFEVVEAN